MLFEPILISLDTPRKFKLTPKALMRAEKKINELRGAGPNEWASVDYLIYRARLASQLGVDSLPRDLAAVILWSGLLDFWPPPAPDNPAMTVEYADELFEISPLTRGEIMTQIFDHYSEVATKKKLEKEPAPPNGADANPLAQRPGSTSGASQ